MYKTLATWDSVYFLKFMEEWNREWYSRTFPECRYRGDSLKCRRPEWRLRSDVRSVRRVYIPSDKIQSPFFNTLTLLLYLLLEAQRTKYEGSRHTRGKKRTKNEGKSTNAEEEGIRSELQDAWLFPSGSAPFHIFFSNSFSRTQILHYMWIS